PISFRPVVITFFVASVTSYVICILGGVLFDWTMYEIWAPLLPGFTWPLTTLGFFTGLIWLVGYSLYVAALLVLPYNYLMRRPVTVE
ncbi:MAG TPA: hypothetical protein VFI27_04740, partial [candidate division Zixibacteria bacterium]|nr:hypothetical protein [candidate division Zixibacteria bacterium]